MKLSRVYLRSIRGQLTLLGVTYLGAVALAVVALCLRNWFFESTVREKYAPVPQSLQSLARDVAEGKGGKEQLEKLSLPEVDLLYGYWIDQPELDAEGRLIQCLLSSHGPLILSRVRRTLVCGNPQQRARAADILSLPPEALRPEAIRLLQFARVRAQRRGEQTLARQASAVLDQLESN
jgi:hypothetical protein